MLGTPLTSTQAIEAIVAPAVMISSSALFILGLTSRYIALLTRIRLLNDEKRQLNKKLLEAKLDAAENSRLLHINTQINALLKATWYVRNAILCHILAVICFVLTSFAIGANFFVSQSFFRGAPLYPFFFGMLLVLCAVTCMALDIFISSRVILVEVKDEG